MSQKKPTVEQDAFSEGPVGDEELVISAESAGDANASAGQAAADPSPEQALADARRQRDELQDKLLRSQAECANIAKRLSQQHRTDIQQAPRTLAKGILPILDGLERTIQSIDEAGRSDPIAEGVKLLRDQFVVVLRQNHIEPIESVGRRFNPELHEAMIQDAKSELPAGTVCAEYERGYTLHQRVLRHAKVVVSARPGDEASASEPAGGGDAASPDGSGSMN